MSGHVADGPADGRIEDAFDILLVARHPFGGRPPLGDWQMARALSRDHRVLYVEPPTVLRPGSLHVGGRRRSPAIRRIDPRLFVVRPVSLPGATRPATAALSDRLIARQVTAAADRVLGPAPVMLTFDPLRGPLPSVERSMLVYWRRDRLADLTVSPAARWLGERDRELLAAADLVSCTASTLVEEATRYSAAPVDHLPNGCDVDHFAAPQPRPVGVPDGEVVLGFVGGAFWRLDLALVDEVARRRPSWQLVFVGDADAPLPDHANLHRQPYLAYDHIPAFVQHLDVGLIPYDMSLAFNHGSFPIKAFEYLAAGVPVVSTMMPALADLSPWVRRAAGADDFIAAVEAALRDGPEAASCRAVARDNTWADRAEQLGDRIRARAGRLGDLAQVHDG